MGSNTDSNHHLTCTKTRRLCPKRPLTEHTHRMFLQERVAFITQLNVYIYIKKRQYSTECNAFFSCDKKPFPRNVQCDYNPFTANQQQVLHYCTKTGAIINLAGGKRNLVYSERSSLTVWDHSHLHKVEDKKKENKIVLHWKYWKWVPRERLI